MGRIGIGSAIIMVCVMGAIGIVKDPQYQSTSMTVADYIVFFGGIFGILLVSGGIIAETTKHVVRVEFVVDLVIADPQKFESRDVFSREENGKITNELQKLPDHRKRLAYLLNAYADKGLEFVSAKSEEPLHFIFVGPGIWNGFFIFRKIQY